MIYLIYFLLLVVLINIYFRIAGRYKIVDNPVDRSSHDEPVIRGAGIIVPVGLTIWFIWSGYQYPWFYSGFMLISIISFLDDISHMMRWIRFLVQLVAVPLLMMQVGFTDVPWWVTGITLFVAIGIINAFNFMDGINGMMGIFSLLTLATLWFVNTFQVHFIDDELIYAATLAVLVFGFYNFRTHARCFAGDVGPAAIAFIVIFLLTKLILTTGNIFYLWFLLVFGIDTFLTIVYRLKLGENILQPHRHHLYQLLANEAAIAQLRVSAGYSILQMIINLSIILAIHYGSFSTLLWISSATVLLLAIMYIYLKNKHKPSQGK